VSDIAAFFLAVQSGDAAKVGALLDADASLANAKKRRAIPPCAGPVNRKKGDSRPPLASGAVLELPEAAAAGQLARVKQIVDKDPARRTVLS